MNYGQMNNHHRSLCPQKIRAASRKRIHLVDKLSVDVCECENVCLLANQMVLIQTVAVDITNLSNGRDKTRILLDSCSQRTYERQHQKTYLQTYALSQDSDQPLYLPNLIRIFARLANVLQAGIEDPDHTAKMH